MTMLTQRPPDAGNQTQVVPQAIIPEARRRGRLRHLGIGILVALVLAAAGAVGGVIGNGGSQRHVQVRGGGPHEGAIPSARLYTVTNSIVWTEFGLVTASTRALYGLGALHRLIRVQIDPLAVTTNTLLPGFPNSPFDLNVAAFGLGALWAAAGDLVRLNPTTLSVTARFALPEPALVVIVAGNKIWVGTPTSLFAVDPVTGAVEHVDPLSYRPAAMAVSPSGRILYVLGDRQGATNPDAVLSSFNSSTGALLGERTLGYGTAVNGLASTKGGAWVSLMMSHRTPTATITLYKGSSLVRGPQIRLGHQGAATRGYVAGHLLWLIDGRGTSETKCASAVTGRIRAKGSAGVTSESGAMLTVKGRAFLLAPYPSRRLLEINAASACKS